MKRRLFAWIIAAICALGIGSSHVAAQQDFKDLSLYHSTEKATLYVSKSADASLCEVMSEQLMKIHYSEQPDGLKHAISVFDGNGEVLFVTVIH